MKTINKCLNLELHKNLIIMNIVPKCQADKVYDNYALLPKTIQYNSYTKVPKVMRI